MKFISGLVALCRMLLAALFIFSGFVKGVDPWGTAIKLTEYFNAFGLEPLSQGSLLFSILLSGGEMLLGFCLLFRLGIRFVSIVVFWVLSLFTLLTLFLALWNPVADCGCFGDAIKLTNWQTFYKNVVLLALSVVVCLNNRPRHKDYWEWNISASSPRRSRGVEWGLGVLFALFSFGVGSYCYHHLPLIDFLPFKVGTNLSQARRASSSTQGELLTTLLYKDRENGQIREFSLNDTTWYDSLRWEFVDTRIVEKKTLNDPLKSDPALSEFSIFDAAGDHTERWLNLPRGWFLLTLSNPEVLSDRCREHLTRVADYAEQNGMELIAVSPLRLPADSSLRLGNHSVRLYNIDGTILKMVIRATEGLLLIKEGTILAKWNCRDIPEVIRADSSEQLLSWVAERPVQLRLRWLLGVGIAGILLLYLSYFIGRGRR